MIIEKRKVAGLTPVPGYVADHQRLRLSGPMLYGLTVTAVRGYRRIMTGSQCFGARQARARAVGALSPLVVESLTQLRMARSNSCIEQEENQS